MCTKTMDTAHDYLITLIQKKELEKLTQLDEFIKEVYGHVHTVQIAEIAALCSANIYTITYENSRSILSEEYEKVMLFLRDFPESMHIRAAYLTVCRVAYLDTSTYRKVPDKLISDAKGWAQQYPTEIEFPEGYFGLLLARLEYAQAHDQRNEQRRLFREMKAVAERTDYSEYNEDSDMLASIKTLQQVYGYQ